MRFLGIDPGKTGALAVIDDQGFYTYVVDMPETPSDLADELEAMRDETYGLTAAIEKQQAMPGQGVSSTFQTGYGYGLLIGTLASLSIPFVEVRASKWKSAMGLQGKDKSESRKLAQSLFPAAELHRVRDHGRAEALLLAVWLQREERRA